MAGRSTWCLSVGRWRLTIHLDRPDRRVCLLALCDPETRPTPGVR